MDLNLLFVVDGQLPVRRRYQGRPWSQLRAEVICDRLEKVLGNQDRRNTVNSRDRVNLVVPAPALLQARTTGQVHPRFYNFSYAANTSSASATSSRPRDRSSRASFHA